MSKAENNYRGRLAPTPSGYLHAGHAATFVCAAQRAAMHNGQLILRIDDLDRQRCHQQFIDACLEDLRWLGLRWQEGPDCGGPHAPYLQSKRMEVYRTAFDLLQRKGFLYPCQCSRKDISNALHAPHANEESEPLYPGICRGRSAQVLQSGNPVAWRFRVPHGRILTVDDIGSGQKQFVCGTDLGDFVVWRKDDLPAYQLATVADDIDMQITEVVRGQDLLLSTARQVLLFEALEAKLPSFVHCPLVTDANGRRLAKRSDSLSLRALRAQNVSAAEVIGFQTYAPTARDSRKDDSGISGSVG